MTREKTSCPFGSVPNQYVPIGCNTDELVVLFVDGKGCNEFSKDGAQNPKPKNACTDDERFVAAKKRQALFTDLQTLSV